MAKGIAYFLDAFPEYKALVGEILLSYSELESEMIDLVATAAGIPMDNAVRILYRLRGAQSRLDVAEAIVRPSFTKIGLGPQCGLWLGAMRRCKLIRNQYAHCGWMVFGDRLTLTNLEEAAQTTDGNIGLEFHPIDLKLLERQVTYFRYALDIAFYLQREAKFRRDRRRKHKHVMPKSIAAPPLDSRHD